MARNSYFSHASSDQNAVEDLTIEVIKIYGHDMVYIPRTLVNKDEIFGEDTISKFENGNPIEMFIESIDGFEGDGDFISKFGLEIRDSVTFIVSKKRSGSFFLLYGFFLEDIKLSNISDVKHHSFPSDSSL